MLARNERLPVNTRVIDGAAIRIISCRAAIRMDDRVVRMMFGNGRSSLDRTAGIDVPGSSIGILLLVVVVVVGRR